MMKNHMHIPEAIRRNFGVESFLVSLLLPRRTNNNNIVLLLKSSYAFSAKEFVLLVQVASENSPEERFSEAEVMILRTLLHMASMTVGIQVGSHVTPNKHLQSLLSWTPCGILWAAK